VAAFAAAVVPALDAAREAFAFAYAGYVHELADLEAIDEDAVARFGFVF